MLKLHYIIIDRLPHQERRYLEKNLKTCQAEENGCHIIIRDAVEMIYQLPAEESIFISGNRRHLKQASEYGMAVLGYLPTEQVALEDRERDTSEPETGLEADNGIADSPADMYAEGMEEIDLDFLQRVYERRHGLPWTILETERCILREFTLKDLDDLFELYAGEGMTDYMEPLYAYEEEKAYQIAYIRHMYGFYGYGMWLVIEKATGRLIGRAGIEHREETGNELELGYAIGISYQRKGYATEVCKAILAYAREKLHADRITCLIEKGNLVSCSLAEKLGFIFAGELVIEEKVMQKYVRKL